MFVTTPVVNLTILLYTQKGEKTNIRSDYKCPAPREWETTSSYQHLLFLTLSKILTTTAQSQLARHSLPYHGLRQPGRFSSAYCLDSGVDAANGSSSMNSLNLTQRFILLKEARFRARARVDIRSPPFTEAKVTSPLMTGDGQVVTGSAHLELMSGR